MKERFARAREGSSKEAPDVREGENGEREDHGFDSPEDRARAIELAAQIARMERHHLKRDAEALRTAKQELRHLLGMEAQEVSDEDTMEHETPERGSDEVYDLEDGVMYEFQSDRGPVNRLKFIGVDERGRWMLLSPESEQELVSGGYEQGKTARDMALFIDPLVGSEQIDRAYKRSIRAA